MLYFSPAHYKYVQGGRRSGVSSTVTLQDTVVQQMNPIEKIEGSTAASVLPGTDVAAEAEPDTFTICSWPARQRLQIKAIGMVKGNSSLWYNHIA